jgi:hypothetical protein
MTRQVKALAVRVVARVDGEFMQGGRADQPAVLARTIPPFGPGVSGGQGLSF